MTPKKNKPRRPTDSEMLQLVAELLDAMNGVDRDEAVNAVDEAFIAVFDHYQTDSPGYAGKLMLVAYSGGPELGYVWNRHGKLERIESLHEDDAKL